MQCVQCIMMERGHWWYKTCETKSKQTNNIFFLKTKITKAVYVFKTSKANQTTCRGKNDDEVFRHPTDSFAWKTLKIMFHSLKKLNIYFILKLEQQMIKQNHDMNQK